MYFSINRGCANIIYSMYVYKGKLALTYFIYNIKSYAILSKISFIFVI